MARSDESGLQKKRVSIKDVAMASGVSLTTVSLVLNREDQRISQATRERVLDAIQKLGYRPNRLAQGLQNRRSRILAVLVPQLQHAFADVYFGELISGIYDQASEAGYKTLLEVASPSFVQGKAYLELFERCFVDGLLFLGSHDEHTFVHEMAEDDRPVLLVNNVIGQLDHVMCDYRAAGYDAAVYLARLGHRKLGLIHGPVSVRTARDVIDGFRAGLAEQGVALEETQCEYGLFTEEGGAAAADALLARVPGMTAIFAGNDKMAIGAMQRLLTKGIRVPNDVSIMGCDDIRQATFVTPALTTIRTPLYQVGRLCCQRMLERLRSKGESDECREIVPVELVERDSTAAPLQGWDGLSI